ncbi:MAG: hypothetical protein M1837_005318 [Sclerophora amabilis]|nr:MAG: hypothetical protein M1837_005318 [Sclerophora amabilis]
MSYRVTEPHPSVPTTRYIHTGRGGAGNFTQVAPRSITPSRTASGPASRIPLGSSSSKSGKFIAGRGGAGNVHLASERAIFSFDEELAQQQLREERRAPVFHVGRGGAGNVAADERRDSFSGSERSRGSIESIDSAASDPAPPTDGKARKSLESVIKRFGRGRSSS